MNESILPNFIIAHIHAIWYYVNCIPKILGLSIGILSSINQNINSPGLSILVLPHFYTNVYAIKKRVMHVTVKWPSNFQPFTVSLDVKHLNITCLVKFHECTWHEFNETCHSVTF